MEKSKSLINRYNTFGLRERWLEYYLNHTENYFDTTNHGLNVKKQLPVFKKWLVDCNILDGQDVTEDGKLMSQVYFQAKIKCWEIIWTNLCNNSELFAWYIERCNFAQPYKKDSLDNMLSDDFPQYTATVRENSLKAFVNTFKESPFGSTIPMGTITKESGKVILTRLPHNEISLVAVAYSLYRYAERQKRHMLSVSEFYDENQKEGAYRQFGISREILEKLLLSLQEESNHVLRAELNMGLDNIILREDLTSKDILKLMLK